MGDNNRKDDDGSVRMMAMSGGEKPSSSSGFQTYAMEPLLVFYMFTSFVKYPVFQTLLFEKSCVVRYKANIFNPFSRCLVFQEQLFGNIDNFQDELFCQNTSLVHNDVDLQTDANHLYLLSTLCILVPSIPSALVLGSLSDIWNAKIPVLVPLFGLVVGDINYILQSVFFDVDPHWLLASDFACGICGGYSALIGTVFSYSAKKSKNSCRGRKIAFLEGGMGLGATFGFLFSGLIRRYLDFSGTFVFILFLHIICILYVIVFTKSIRISSTLRVGASIADDNRLIRSLKQRVMDVWLVTTKLRPTRIILLLSLLALVVELFSFSGVNDIQYSFFRFKLKWTDKEYGWYSGLTYGLGTASVLFLYPWLRRICGLDDLAICAVALLMKIASLISIAFVFSNWFAFATVPLSVFNRCISAALRTTVSESVEVYEQGRIFSVISILDSIVSMGGSLIFNTLYPLTLPSFSYLCYIIVAVVLLVPLFISLYLLYRKRSLPGSNSTMDSNSDFSI
uniref:Proton-coupled folate transporter n=1 Tax=Syphacia muris TaxID=451379 RepID=A0A158R3R9_9BILA